MRVFKRGKPCESGSVSRVAHHSDTDDMLQDDRMVPGRGLLWVYVVMLVPACTGLPTNAQSRTDTIHTIVSIAQTTLVHIHKLQTQLPANPLITVASPPIKGLSSISRDLSLLDNQLQDPTLGTLGQIHADVSSLSGWVRFLAESMDCLPAARAETGQGPASDGFSESYVYLCLMKVKVYLDKLLLNEDKLSTC
ncbi:unnamed protein product [Merluccius merluccius]